MYFSNQGSICVCALVPPMVWMNADAAGRQAAHRLLHVGAVVLGTDVLHEADRDHRVVAARGVAVVVEADVDGQVPVVLLRPRHLLARHGVADDVGAVLLGGERREAGPAAAEVQHAHPRAQADLAADQIQLGLLGGVQGVGAFVSVGARVDHARVEHRLVQIVADVVVLLADLESARGLAVEQARLAPAAAPAPSSCPARPGTSARTILSIIWSSASQSHQPSMKLSPTPSVPSRSTRW